MRIALKNQDAERTLSAVRNQREFDEQAIVSKAGRPQVAKSELDALPPYASIVWYQQSAAQNNQRRKVEVSSQARTRIGANPTQSRPLAGSQKKIAPEQQYNNG
jgi:hypothetical protein